ncbi:hypothetical protein BaRGS_00032418 [Batillaria attramentaria]|uniref:Uncharacterized protein n=1 Tax=Batillaria attramentaria TaxID=370345 RepID=A0ABD0JMW5_9CAEN
MLAPQVRLPGSDWHLPDDQPCKIASRWHTTVAEADSVYLFLSGLGVMIGMLEVHAANMPLAVCDEEYPYPYSERYTDVR